MIADELNKLKETKAAIKQALIDKGQNPTDEFASYANNISGISGGSNLLSDIGWNISEQPELITAVDYAKNILVNPKSSYSEDKQLVIFPKVEELELKTNMFASSNLRFFPEGIKLSGTLSNAFGSTPVYGVDLRLLSNGGTSLNHSFYHSDVVYLKVNENFGKGVSDMYGTFESCMNLKSVSTLDISSATDLTNLFTSCQSIEYINLVGTSNNVSKSAGIFKDCFKLKFLSVPEDLLLTGSNYEYGHLSGIRVPKIYGSFDYKGVTSYGNSYYSWVAGFQSNTYTRYMVIKNLGYYESGKYLNMEYSRVWGIANDEVPDARQSLIDSLITYSFDRASAGYSTQTWKLHSPVKALLTEDEIAQITAKGYTIA